MKSLKLCFVAFLAIISIQCIAQEDTTSTTSFQNQEFTFLLEKTAIDTNNLISEKEFDMNLKLTLEDISDIYKLHLMVVNTNTGENIISHVFNVQGSNSAPSGVSFTTSGNNITIGLGVHIPIYWEFELLLENSSGVTSKPCIML